MLISNGWVGEELRQACGGEVLGKGRAASRDQPRARLIGIQYEESGIFLWDIDVEGNHVDDIEIWIEAPIPDEVTDPTMRQEIAQHRRNIWDAGREMQSSREGARSELTKEETKRPAPSNIDNMG